MMNAASVALNAAGLIASISPLAPFLRTITLYDQEKYLKNAAEVASQKGAASQAITAAVNNITNGAKILQGIPFYRSAILDFALQERSRMCDHPIEDGSMVSDHKIKEPVTFSCSLAMPEFLGGLVVDELKDYYRESKKIIIQCTTGVYMNMILSEIPTQITSDTASRPIFNLRFREVVIAIPEIQGTMNQENNISSVSDSDTKKQTVLSDFITDNEFISQVLGKISTI